MLFLTVWDTYRRLWNQENLFLVSVVSVVSLFLFLVSCFCCFWFLSFLVSSIHYRKAYQGISCTPWAAPRSYQPTSIKRPTKYFNPRVGGGPVFTQTSASCRGLGLGCRLVSCVTCGCFAFAVISFALIGSRLVLVLPRGGGSCPQCWFAFVLGVRWFRFVSFLLPWLGAHHAGRPSPNLAKKCAKFASYACRV